MRTKVLWIEDSAFDETAILATPVHLSGEFELDVALSATQAVNKLRASRYDAVVVDIRIPPGEDKRWIKIYYGSNKDARLGLMLLRTVLRKGGVDWEPDFVEKVSEQISDPRRYGVLSVENKAEIGPDLAELQVVHHKDKATNEPEVLLALFREIIAHLDNDGNDASK
jgi:hypothetical protein